MASSLKEKKSKKFGIEMMSSAEYEELMVKILAKSPKMLSPSKKEMRDEMENYLIAKLEKDDKDKNQDSSFTEEYSPTGSEGSSETEESETKSDTDTASECSCSNCESKSDSDVEVNDANQNTNEQKESTSQLNSSSDDDAKIDIEFNINALKELKIKNEENSNKSPIKNSDKNLNVMPNNKDVLPLPTIQTMETDNRIVTTNRRPSLSPILRSPINLKYKIVKKIVKFEPLSPPTNVVHMNSITEGERVLQWLINPINVNTFFSLYWERKSLLLKRNQKHLYSHLMSIRDIDPMLLNFYVEYKKHIQIISHKNDVAVNCVGRARPANFWQYYDHGCTIRLLNPQTFIKPLYDLCAKLQEYFHCSIGVDGYLISPTNESMMPHYDDVETFVLQIQGQTQWKLYDYRKQTEVLPRTSSECFKNEEIGTPLFDQILFPGDVLYLPRGTIYKVSTEDCDSLHLNLRIYKKTSYADLLETMMPILMKRAFESNIEMRQGLPLNIWHKNGMAFKENQTDDRIKIQKEVIKRLRKLFYQSNTEELIDDAVDQLAKKYQREAISPEISKPERDRSIFGSRTNINNNNDAMEFNYRITLNTKLRLLRANIMRLVNEENQLRLYFHIDNPKDHCEKSFRCSFIVIDENESIIVKELIKLYPKYLQVSDFNVFNRNSKKIEFATKLWERGLLMMEQPFL